MSGERLASPWQQELLPSGGKRPILLVRSEEEETEVLYRFFGRFSPAKLLDYDSKYFGT